MQLHFAKMHGLGNDFVIIDYATADNPDESPLTPAIIRAWSDRSLGIGFDQLLWISPPRDDNTLAYYRIYNADGQEVEQCGNGARCVAAAIAKRKDFKQSGEFALGSPGGRLIARLIDEHQVEINMGQPRFEPEQIPFIAAQRQQRYPVQLDGEALMVSALSVGNPHCVMVVNDVSSAPVDRLGRALGAYERFPQGVNVGFLQIQSRDQAQLRVFERGVGETRACGTGACAAMVAGHQLGRFDDEVHIHLPGGELVINWRGGDSDIVMRGPATFAFEGQITL